jgi:hypothetical protein
MAFYSKVIADSINPTGQRLTTLEICYPRFIHSEIMTHRDRARNSASSRAIPWPVMMKRITEQPVVPIKWLAEQKGMQGGDCVDDELASLARYLWIEGSKRMCELADAIHNIGRTYKQIQDGNHPVAWIEGDNGKWDFCHLNVPLPERLQDVKIHKSLPNRLTEPWMWITVVMTATNWKNLERLRLHGDAEVHFQELMKHVTESMKESIPEPLAFGQWHTPYFLDEYDELVKWALEKGFLEHEVSHLACQISTARCARVSYLTQDGKRDFAKDIELFDRLCQGSGFGHWSPHEHVAMSSTKDERSGPYKGWKQFRKLFPNECGD